MEKLWWSPFRQRGRRISKSNVKPPHIGGDLVGVDVSFRSFLCAIEKETVIVTSAEKLYFLIVKTFGSSTDTPKPL